MPSVADLELSYLRTKVGVAGPSLPDARLQAYGANEHAYFAALSGLPYARSLADHRRTYYQTQTGVSGSLNDTARAFWEAQLAITGPALYPETTLYPSLTLYPQGA